jgi:hypothetical protein
MDQHVQSWQDVPNGLLWWRWVLISTKVHNHPSYIPQEAHRDLGLDKGEQRMNYTQANYIVTKLWAISNYVPCNITKFHWIQYNRHEKVAFLKISSIHTHEFVGEIISLTHKSNYTTTSLLHCITTAGTSHKAVLLRATELSSFLLLLALISEY